MSTQTRHAHVLREHGTALVRFTVRNTANKKIAHSFCGSGEPGRVSGRFQADNLTPGTGERLVRAAADLAAIDNRHITAAIETHDDAIAAAPIVGHHAAAQ